MTGQHCYSLFLMYFDPLSSGMVTVARWNIQFKPGLLSAPSTLTGSCMCTQEKTAGQC